MLLVADDDFTAPPPTPPASGRGEEERSARRVGRDDDKGSQRPTQRSRELRRDATPAERKLWSVLSNRQCLGVRFNRQFPIGPFVGDFVSRGAKLVIEVDGDDHAFKERSDAARTRFIEGEGYRVIRFWNNDVIERLEGVVIEIERVLNAFPSRLREGLGEGMFDGGADVDSPSPNPSRKREGSS